MSGYKGPERAADTAGAVEDLIDWWIATAEDDLAKVAPKAVEYSSSDLLVIGSGIAPWLPDPLRLEAAIGFYLLGKASRITGALMEGRTPSSDSWDDAAIYSFMGRRVRATGRWP